ncbi:MAG: hypothetical protein LBH25_10810 [Fibromonadaceae bacterium]|jgi:hypothetical protein|nr:hypothetical protein [Fibromonadaceae bacterium]
MAKTQSIRLAAILAIVVVLTLSSCGTHGLEDFLNLGSSSSEADSSSLGTSSSSSTLSSSGASSPSGSQNCTEKVPASIIPEGVRSQFESLIPIYSGNMPPDISGQYKADKLTLVGSSLSNDNIGSNCVDVYCIKRWEPLDLAFIKEPNGKFSYQEQQANSQSGSGAKVDIAIVGCGDNFTAYFISTGTSNGVSIKQSKVVSGTLTSTGISNYHNAFIILDKGPDPNNIVVPVNTYRVHKDGDGLAERHNWITTN